MDIKPLVMMAVGDMILRHPNSEPLFSLVAPVLRSADIVVGQGEIPLTSRGVVTCAKSAFDYTPSPPGDPRSVSALAYAGFNVITLASNHSWDSGIPGVEDTIAGLKNYGIAYTGAGMNIDEARQPAIVERNGTRFGFLNYNCVGPQESWANPLKPGCAYIHIMTSYELADPCPGAPPAVYTAAEPRSLKEMIDDISRLRPLCDVLVVKFHKGLGLVPVKLAGYEQQVSYAAIDAGADLILAEHAHILKGIEIYKGKVIFHNLGNFACVMPVISDEFFKGIQKIIKNLYGFEPKDPSNFEHPEGRMTIIAKLVIENRKIVKASYLPCLINEKVQPEILKHDERGQQVFNFVDNATKLAGLNARFKWEGDEVVIFI